MGEKHLSDATLSAHLDRELSALEERDARLHLAACGDCGVRLAAFARLDLQLTAEPALACASARSLVSARLDGELPAECERGAREHLGSCAACQADLARWSRLDQTIAALPGAIPSRRVDAAIRELARPRRRAVGVRGIALRGALSAAVAVILVMLAGLPPRAPDAALPDPATAPIVASIQQVALNPRTNTLYVLETDQAAVAARVADTNLLITRIQVGGRPIALTFDESANAVLVLDAEAKTITTIDARANAVVSSNAVAVAGTPTSLQVAAGKIVVTAVADPKASPAVPGATPTGLVAILDSSSKLVEIVRTIDVAPRLIVLDPSGVFALLVSLDRSIVADASTYRQIDRLPGGVGGAFGGEDGTTIAVLSPDAAGARVSFGGPSAPAALTLAGRPIAITSLPDGGFGVLLSAGGRGQVVTLGPNGKALGTPVEVALGTDITFDPATGNYAVTGPNGVRYARAATAASSPTPAPSASAPAASATPSGSPRPSASASPARTPAPSAVSLPLVPDGARLLWAGAYAFALGDLKVATVVGGSGSRLWFVDQYNILESLDTATGHATSMVPLPRDAKISLIATSPNFVYAIDAAKGRVYTLDLGVQRLLDAASVAPAANAVAAATTPDDRLWLVTGSSSLVGYDPRSGRVQIIDVPSASLVAVTADSSGRVWFASEDGRRVVGSYDATSRTVTELPVDRRGAVTALAVDPSGALLIGTDAGELFAVRGRSLALAAQASGRIVALSVEFGRTTWYASQDGAGVRFAPIDGSVPASLAPTTASGLSIDVFRRAWLPDRSTGGFYIVLQNAR